MSISIIDYGMANLRSVQKAFEQVGHRAAIISEPEQIDRADKVVLPGVGAFQDAVATLRAKNLDAPILRHIERGRPFLGVCLGCSTSATRTASIAAWACSRADACGSTSIRRWG